MTKISVQRLMFVYLCLVWGTTWIAMKTATVVVPPALFAGLRWVAAGVVMLVVLRLRGRLRLPWAHMRRLCVVSVLLIALNQIFMMYGLRLVSSGLAAVVNCALTPLTLLGFSVALGQERVTRRAIWAMGLGVCGVCVLFGPAAVSGRLDAAELLGAALIILGTLTYSAGSVLARPVMGGVSPFLVAGLVNLLGGVLLLVLAMLFEPGAWAAADLRWGAGPWWAFVYLLGPAAVVASTIYFFLVRDWGASKAGNFAFVSPIIAVLLGVVLSGEALHPIDAVGMAMMLGAAWVALRVG